MHRIIANHIAETPLISNVLTESGERQVVGQGGKCQRVSCLFSTHLVWNRTTGQKAFC
jgi:hypothetical protein